MGKKHLMAEHPKKIHEELLQLSKEELITIIYTLRATNTARARRIYKFTFKLNNIKYRLKKIKIGIDHILESEYGRQT